ncbi:MAG: GNAT family N-acetyltransferase [SAR324 cluster bacterium]|nr:GNAT family N-acetyltransferase [SAR324 cluster bacterium]
MPTYTVNIHSRMAEIDQSDWDALVGDGSPFLEWDWLDGLERTGCVSPETGWVPQHVVVKDGERMVAACPLYIKSHSQGEFVFDHQWAHAARSAGIAYYPKMLVAVPFTPATGIRLMTAPGADRPALVALMGGALLKMCEQTGLSSVHVNFCGADEISPLREAGFLERVGMQYHWENHGFQEFEDYLRLFRSKRRNKLRREIREMDDMGIEISVASGNDIEDHLFPILYELYKTHIEKLYWGQLYLNQAFFEHLANRFKRNLCFITASYQGRIVAGTFNVQKNGVFYGRYWGAFEDLRYLHFNVCYYAAIDHCIRTGIHRFEPGAGGDFKQLRGFEARLTHSMHHLRHPALNKAVSEFLQSEREHMQQTADWINANSQYKPQHQ